MENHWEPPEQMPPAPEPPPSQAEPVAWGQLGMLNGHTYLRMTYDHSPYPPPPSVVRNLNLVPLFASPPSASAESAEAPELPDAESWAFVEGAPTTEQTKIRISSIIDAAWKRDRDLLALALRSVPASREEIEAAALPAEARAEPKTRSELLREAGFTRRPSWRSLPSDAEPEDGALPKPHNGDPFEIARAALSQPFQIIECQGINSPIATKATAEALTVEQMGSQLVGAQSGGADARVRAGFVSLADERDAARYRHLRDRVFGVRDRHGVESFELPPVRPTMATIMRGSVAQHFDAAIDAAMAESAAIATPKESGDAK